MRDNLRTQIYNNLASKETKDLLDIWQNGDPTEWEEGVFDIVKGLLLERLGRLAPQSIETQVAQILARVEEYLEKDELDKALSECETAIQMEPDLASAYNYRGQIREEMGQLELAITDYRKAIQLDPGWPEPWINMGIVEKELEDRYAESTAKEHLKQAFAYAWTNEPEAALQECELALPDLPRIASAYNELGVVFNEMYQLETARGWYREALRLNRRFRAARKNLNKVEQQLKEEQFRRVAGRRPGASEKGWNTIPEPWQPETEEDLQPVPEWVYMDEASYVLTGWPGHRTRQGRTGYDPLETDFEWAHMEGVMLRMMLTGKLRTRNPIYLLFMTFVGLVFFLPWLGVVDLLYENQLPVALAAYSIPYLIVGLALLANVTLSLWAKKPEVIERNGNTFY